jgi:hypothetical protein
MEHPANHYATLGLKPDATADQIKRAYHEAAKRAHPDAGGNAETMQQVNQAYQILSDSTTRADYDRQRAEATRPPEPEPSEPSSAEATLTPEQHHQLRQRQARRAAWEFVRNGAGLAVLLGAIAYFLGRFAATTGQKLFLAVLSFLPVYWVLLGITFLINPDLELHVYDLFSDPRHTNKHEIMTLLGLFLAFFPLAAVWGLLYLAFHGLV